jgi:hypothetical protein
MMNRPRACRAPANSEAITMQGRYGMVIWVRITASLNLAGLSRKP